MITIILKTTTGEIAIQDLAGVKINTSGVNITSIFSLDQINSSTILRSYVTSGDIIVNDGTSDLSVSEGLDHITLVTTLGVTKQIINNAVYFGTTPPSSTTTIWMNTTNGMPMIYDSSRSKWLSIDRYKIYFTKQGATKGDYLNIGWPRSSETGGIVHRAGTVVAVWGKAVSGSTSKGIKIKDSTSDIFNFTMSDLFYSNDNVNADFVTDNFLRVYVESSGATIRNPIFYVEVAWRYVS